MSECACLYGGYDEYDEGGFERAVMRTARKAHRCVECRETIQPGQRYEYFTSKNEGHIFTKKTCAVCAEIRAALYCDGYHFGRMWEDIHNQIFQDGGMSIACIDKLETAAAKTVLQARWQEYIENQS
jgi:hypothetical protein